MLPWLIAVLLVLNLGLFWWGQHHEVPIDPKLPPLPAAAYSIELLDRAGAGDAEGAPAPPPAADTLASAPDQGAAQREGAPPNLQPPSKPATADAAPSAATDAGGGSVAAQTADATPYPVTDPGGLTAPEATPGAEALVPAAIAAGVAGVAAAEPAAPKVVKKRKVKRKRPAKPVEPFLDF